MATRTLKLTMAYDGSAYAGWQRQTKQPSVQAAVEKALLDITREPIIVVASGRTDSGVHALGQVVSFETTNTLPTDALQRALNASLPRDMQVLEISEVQGGFHAIRDALRKRYRYVLYDGPNPDLFRRNYCWHIWQRLDETAMQRAADHLCGKHDFASFQSSGAPRLSTVRTVFAATVTRSSSAWHTTNDPNVVLFEVEADGFLYNMVRAMVGTLVEVGRGAKSPDSMTEVLHACNRKAAGMTAPPQGLFLVRVDYPQQGD